MACGDARGFEAAIAARSGAMARREIRVEQCKAYAVQRASVNREVESWDNEGG